MTIAARLQTSSGADRRSWPRYQLRLDASLRASGAKVTIHNLSSTGMLIETRATLCSFDSLEVDLPEVGITRAFVVWSSGRFHGCKFQEPLSKSTISAALLRGEPSSSTEVTGSGRTRWAINKLIADAFRQIR